MYVEPCERSPAVLPTGSEKYTLAPAWYCGVEVSETAAAAPPPSSVINRISSQRFRTTVKYSCICMATHTFPGLTQDILSLAIRTLAVRTLAIRARAVGSGRAGA